MNKEDVMRLFKKIRDEGTSQEQNSDPHAIQTELDSIPMANFPGKDELETLAQQQNTGSDQKNQNR